MPSGLVRLSSTISSYSLASKPSKYSVAVLVFGLYSTDLGLMISVPVASKLALLSKL